MPDIAMMGEGLRFPEGPVAMGDGSIIVVEVESGCIVRVAPDGTKTIVARPGGGPNGLAIGPDGNLYCCNNGGLRFGDVRGMRMPQGQADDYAGGRIERIDIDSGQVEILYREGSGFRLNGPNDIVFDAHGGFWFTDLGKTRARDRDLGVVYYGRADGSACRQVLFPLNSPNGIGLSPDGRTLYVAETVTCILWAFDLAGPGELAGSGGVHAGRFLYRPPTRARFDSLAVERDGNICVATLEAGGITVIDPNGRLVEFVEMPDPMTTNICFGGDDLRTAFVTLSTSGRLARMAWRRPGLALAY